MQKISSFTPGVQDWLVWAAVMTLVCGGMVAFIIWRTVSRDTRRRQ